MGPSSETLGHNSCNGVLCPFTRCVPFLPSRHYSSGTLGSQLTYRAGFFIYLKYILRTISHHHPLFHYFINYTGANCSSILYSSSIKDSICDSMYNVVQFVRVYNVLISLKIFRFVSGDG